MNLSHETSLRALDSTSSIQEASDTSEDSLGVARRRRNGSRTRLPAGLMIGGPSPGLGDWAFFSAGGQKKKLLREGEIFNRPKQDVVSSSPTEPSRQCRGGPHLTCKLHPLPRRNWYMSQRAGMTHTNARAPMLAEFGFALIPACISHVKRPIETYFS